MTKKLTALMLIVLSVVGLSVPTTGGVLQQSAMAQPVIEADTLIQETRDEVEQEIEQEAEQEAEQDQEQTQSNEQSVEQSNTADVSQDEENNQANAIVTGDNTASTTQIGENAAVDNEVEAESEGGDAGDAEAEKDSEASSTGGGSGDASASLEQSVDNEATTIQDSSADGNILSNENEFGDDVAIIDQENIAEQNAANIGIQEQDLTQTIDQIQEAANLNVDLDVQVGIQRPPPLPPGAEPGPPGAEELTCPSGFTFNPDTGQCEQFQTAAPSCPSGFTFNPGTDQCVGTQTVIRDPECPPGTNLDILGRCGAGPTCPPEAPTFIPVTNVCVGPGGEVEDPECPRGTNLNILGRCEGAPTCPPEAPTFIPVTNVCVGPETAPPECPPDFRYNPSTNQCERTVTRPPS